MKQTLPGLKTTTLLLLLFIFACSSAGMAADEYDFLNDDYLYEDETEDVFEDLEYFQNELETPYADVPRGHWAYKAVERLAELGLIEGGKDGLFHGDRPMTRYEMAVLVNKILQRYLEWDDTGKVVRYKTVRVKKDRPPPARAPVPAAAAPADAPADEPDEEIMVIMPRRPNLIPEAQDVTVTSPSGEHVTLKRTGRMSVIDESEAAGTDGRLPAVKEVAAEDEQEEEEESGREKEIEEKEPPAAAEPEPEWEERIVKVEEKIDLTQKDLDSIEQLLNTFKKELKDIDKTFKKEIRDVQRVSLKNQRQVEKLKMEDDRFRITGSDSFTLRIGGAVTGDGQGRHETTSANNSLKLTFDSTPDSSEDFSISGTTSVNTILGGRKGYWGYISGDNTAFSLDSINMQFQDKQDDPNNPRNFKIRDLQVGNISVAYSPLTMFGFKVQGLSTSVKLNDYTLNMFAGRTAYHYGRLFGLFDYYVDGDDTQYDRYVYGVNMQTPVFGEVKSMGNIQKIWMYDNHHTNYPGCNTGYWVDLEFEDDPSRQKGIDSDSSYKDIFCLPPEKNSVMSAFVRYPLLDNIYLTGEYAHSTYYKPGYSVNISRDCVPESTDDEDLGEDQVKCDPTDPEKKFNDPTQTDKEGWYPSKERREQDDGFLLLFDYNKGPITIFPIGYAKLGPEFSTKYFGLPGFDMNDLLGGGGLSMLPISIQSLEVYITNFSIDKQQDDNYKYSTYYIWGNETEPMYFDPGAVAYGLSSQSDSTKSLLGTILGFVNNVNTRQETLKIDFWNNDLKYYFNDDINLNFKYSKANVALPTACLDITLETNPITDDHGNIIDKYRGDGVLDCANPESSDRTVKIDVAFSSQDYILNWRTSSRASSETTFGIRNMKLSVDYYVTTLTDLIDDLAPQGKNFILKQKFDYKLTSSANISFTYEKEYDRLPDSDDDEKFPVIDSEEVTLKIETTF